jgi:antitoxin CcdA
MTQRTTITLDNDAFAFLNSIAGSNRSAYINKLLKQAQEDALKVALIQANQEEAEDIDYQNELKDWETTLSDGLSRD